MSDQPEDTATAEAPENLIPGHDSVDSFAQVAFATIVSALKAGNSLPHHGDDFDFYSSYDAFRKFCHENGDHALQMIRRIIGNQLMSNALVKSSLNLEIEDKMEALIDANDSILEKVGILLDEASGAKKKPETLLIESGNNDKNVSIASWNKKTTQPSKSFSMMYSKTTMRPQLKFEERVDNSNTPFRPKIKKKPNALKPLDSDGAGKYQSVQEFITQQRQEVETGKPAVSAAHPYQYEIEQCEPTGAHLEVTEGLEYRPVNLTPLTLVSTSKQLEELSALLNRQTQFAVDLEHHSYRSFQGFTCLMQISTLDHDFIVDTLSLRSELHILNESFTDPKIVKVFHGAVMDIEWLQKDFGLYVVNLFDTGEASHYVGLARHSLAHLLKHYCNVETNKQYQLADWRIRPLPDAMVKYAREDTHYLLYIYNRMKADLIDTGNKQKNKLMAVYQKSKQISLRKYNKPMFTSDSYLVALQKKSRKNFNPKQIHAFKLLYAWRDSVGRQEDESTGYILPNHMLFQIAEHLPRESSGVLACCNPIPPLLMQNLAEVHRLVVQARNYHGKAEVNVSESSPVPPTKSEEVTFASRVVDPLENILHCPHDLTPQEHSHDQQPVSSLLKSSSLQMSKPTVPLLAQLADAVKTTKGSKSEKIARIAASILNPFKMYLPRKAVKIADAEVKPSQVAAKLLDADKISLGDVSAKTYLGKKPSLWKLKETPKTVIPDDDTVNPTQAVKAEGATRSKAPEESTVKEEDSLRAQKRKKPSGSGPREEAELKKRPRKDEAIQIPNVAPEEVKFDKAYDYSQYKNQRFIRPAEMKSAPAEGRKRYFKGPQKSGSHRSGPRSTSYVAGHSDRSSGAKGRQKWPQKK